MCISLIRRRFLIRRVRKTTSCNESLMKPMVLEQTMRNSLAGGHFFTSRATCIQARGSGSRARSPAKEERSCETACTLSRDSTELSTDTCHSSPDCLDDGVFQEQNLKLLVKLVITWPMPLRPHLKQRTWTWRVPDPRCMLRNGLHSNLEMSSRLI